MTDCLECHFERIARNLSLTSITAYSNWTTTSGSGTFVCFGSGQRIGGCGDASSHWR
jgi:hypothetical protein